MIATVHSSTLTGISAKAVRVETHIGKGLPGFELVGLAEAAVRESRVRVKAALSHCAYELPPRHIVLSLAPADLRKSGSAFDLAIATSLLAAAGHFSPSLLEGTLVVGELALDGELRSVRGALSHLKCAEEQGLVRAIVPFANAEAARWFDKLEVLAARTLDEVVAYLDGRGTLPLAKDVCAAREVARNDTEDFADVLGQRSAKRAFEIAAVGSHNLLVVGPPGAGKTMLARRFIGILPAPTHDEAMEIATIASAAGLDAAETLARGRPFRAPHHGASEVALIGGGDPIRPGEVTLAHGGVLFLDELPELRRNAIEALRTSMESGVVEISRARMRVAMPARPIVVAAMNPCPCGYAGSTRRVCLCSPERVRAYRQRISGPILDRFDIHFSLSPVPVADLATERREESSADIAARVLAARGYAAERGGGPLFERPIRALLRELSAPAKRLAESAVDKLDLSARSYAKVLRVARSIADLGASAAIEEAHIAEALSFRGARPDKTSRPVSQSSNERKRHVDERENEGRSERDREHREAVR